MALPSSITEGLWQSLIDDVQPGDLVFIQFGHNDAGEINDNRRARGTLPGIGTDKTDIFNLLTDRYDQLGPKKVKPLFADKHTHASCEGARFTAELVAAELRTILETEHIQQP